MVEQLQGKMCQNSLPLGGDRSLGAKISWGRGPHAHIDTTREAIDCATTLPLTVFISERELYAIARPSAVV